jgi:hypothetical protein
MNVKSWVPIFGGATGRVMVAEGVGLSPVSSVWLGEVSVGASWSVFGLPDAIAGLVSASMEALVVGRARVADVAKRRRQEL